MIFKMYNCDFGIKYNDVNYDFEHVDSVAIEDPESHKLVRGSNASNKEGLLYTEGVKEPKMITVMLVGISSTMYNLFKTIYDAKARCECYVIDRTDGSNRIAKNAIIQQQPYQLTVDDSAESMNIQVVFESFDISEDHKS